MEMIFSTLTSNVWIGLRASGNMDVWLNGQVISAVHPNWRNREFMNCFSHLQSLLKNICKMYSVTVQNMY